MFRTVIWVIIAIALTMFAVFNAQPVQVTIWPGFVAELPLSILIVAVFLIGFLPAFMMHAANRWRLNRRIAQQDSTIALLRTPAPAPPRPADAPTAVPPQP